MNRHKKKKNYTTQSEKLDRTEIREWNSCQRLPELISTFPDFVFEFVYKKKEKKSLDMLEISILEIEMLGIISDFLIIQELQVRSQQLSLFWTFRRDIWKILYTLIERAP